MADIIKLSTSTVPTSHANDVVEPNIVKIAKLALILADKDIEPADKLGCIQVGIRMGFLTKEEAVYLQMYTPELESFRSEMTGQ